MIVGSLTHSGQALKYRSDPPSGERTPLATAGFFCVPENPWSAEALPPIDINKRSLPFA